MNNELRYAHGGICCLRGRSLPYFADPHTVYIDVETSSGQQRKDSTNPWHTCKLMGIAITVNDDPVSWYVPVHSSYGDDGVYDLETVAPWLIDILRRAKAWVNHNIKYDCHVLLNTFELFGLSVEDIARLTLIDTLASAKIIDSDRLTLGGYGLDKLSKCWLGEDIAHFEDALAPFLKNNHDYGMIPPGIVGEYACQDVLTDRKLHKYIESRIAPDLRPTWLLERSITRELLLVERAGLGVNQLECAVEGARAKVVALKAAEKLAELSGREFNPNSNPQLYDLLINQWGLPVVEVTDTGSASFDKLALATYGEMQLTESQAACFGLISTYKSEVQFASLFADAYAYHAVGGVLHPTYNQLVQTGRMSVSEPNSQQLNKRAKALIHPRPGYEFISIDYSQIEFRLIVHYCNDTAAIAAYQSDPWTDYHDLVARLVGCSRKIAKTVNFLVGYGGGKAKLCLTLKHNKDFLATFATPPTAGDIERRVDEIWGRLHQQLPGLRAVSKQAELAASTRGYARTLYGRRRHIRDKKWCYKAFNSASQGTAADILKLKLVELGEYLRRSGSGARVVALVHDEFLIESPIERSGEPWRRKLVELLQVSPVDLRVPLRCTVSWSDKSWAECGQEFKFGLTSNGV